MDDNLRIWRSFKLGNLADLIMLDTRQYDRSITDLYWNTDYVHGIANDAGRSLMGSRQENWFYNQLSSSAKRGATWRIIGSQIVFSRVNQSIAFGDESPLNNDAWDGVSSFQHHFHFPGDMLLSLFHAVWRLVWKLVLENQHQDLLRTGSFHSYLDYIQNCFRYAMKLTPTVIVSIQPKQDV